MPGGPNDPVTSTTFGCDNCYGVCPDNAIIKLADGQYEVDYDYCKGYRHLVARSPSVPGEPPG